jgi:hypothetical protein
LEAQKSPDPFYIGSLHIDRVIIVLDVAAVHVRRSDDVMALASPSGFHAKKTLAKDDFDSKKTLVAAFQAPLNDTQRLKKGLSKMSAPASRASICRSMRLSTAFWAVEALLKPNCRRVFAAVGGKPAAKARRTAR